MRNYSEPNYKWIEGDYSRIGIEKEQRQLKEYGGKTMEIPIKEHKKIPDGEHEGIIINVEYRTSPLQYTDYHLAFINDNERFTVKASYPTNITPETIHGRMLARFGLQIAAGLNVDPDKLIGLKCQFSTVNKTTPKGTFPEVMRETLKPLPVYTQQPQPKGIKASPLEVKPDLTTQNIQIVDTQQNNPDQPKS